MPCPLAGQSGNKGNSALRFVLRDGWVGNRAGNARELANVAVRPDDGGGCFVFVVLAHVLRKARHRMRAACQTARFVRGGVLCAGGTAQHVHLTVDKSQGI